MKKIISIFTAAALIAAMTMTVSADDTNITPTGGNPININPINNGEALTTVSLVNQPTYTIIIPEKVEMSASTLSDNWQEVINMKKNIYMISALALMTAPLTAYAENYLNDDEESLVIKHTDEHRFRYTKVTTTVMPSYTVTIPADVDVKYGDLHTEFGKVELTEARIEPESKVTVTLEASGLLKNDIDASKTIAYKIAEETKDAPGETAYEKSEFSAAGEKTDLVINITDEEWKKAYAGLYSDTLTFNVAYSGRSAEELSQSQQSSAVQPTR